MLDPNVTGLATRPPWIQPALDSNPALYLVGCVILGKGYFTYLSLCFIHL